MVKKLSEFQTLTAKRETVNPKLTALNIELARVEDEIEKLLNTLTGANAVLLSYANSKIEELDTHRQALTKRDRGAVGGNHVPGADRAAVGLPQPMGRN